MRTSLLAGVIVLIGQPVFSQEVGTGPKFEVASIKECITKTGSTPAASPERLTLNCWPLKRLIQDAYEIFADGKVDPRNPVFPFVPIEGGPSWMNSAKYSINAKTAEPQSRAMMRGPIMQQLLEDRFHIRLHRETREVTVYIMTVAKNGPKLQPSMDDSCNHIDSTDTTQSLSIQPGGRPWCVIIPPSRDGSHFVWDVKGMGMDVLANLMIPGRPVIDRTGLTGTYDIHLEWWEGDPSASDDGPTTSDANGTSLMRAMTKQLGLRFEAGRGPREFLVIDRLVRPSEN